MLGVFLAAALAAGPSDPPGPGVSAALARERAAAIRDPQYDLTFRVPADLGRRVAGRLVLRFRLDAPHRIVLDFPQPRDQVTSVQAGGREVEAVFEDGHVIVGAGDTAAGANEIAIEFEAGDAALNREDEFLYTLFVPARAQLAFPCFDQPDLKARFRLTLTVPEGWQAVANGAALPAPGRSSADAASGETTLAFAETEPLPTYLFSFATGRFSIETATRNGRELRMFHRETDAASVARNRGAIFDLHASALAWLEDYTGIPYPFGKFDFVAIPSFQFGGMEHAGAILYNAARLMLDESATQNQYLERASLIAHETAHMWFGDLVTMRWFDDVWMKEVFANFMAAKIVNPSFPDLNHDLRFLLAHYPSAYRVDRTAGTNAIRQELANLSDAGQLYGAIIYQKAPIVMRQLELIVGEEGLRDGLREYLKTFAFANATWLDLIRILDARTPQDLAAWSRAWVEERGRPAYETRLRLDAAGRIETLELAAGDPLGRGLTWPQRLRVVLGYPGTISEVRVDAGGTTIAVDAVRGKERPLYVLPNGAGLAYGLFVLDDASREYLVAHVEELPDALTRGSAWITLWDNMLEGRIAPPDLLDAAIRALPREPDEQNVQRVLDYAVHLFWKFLPADTRAARAAVLEPLFRAGLERAGTQSQKAAWFNAYRDTVLSRDGLAWLERVWRRDETIPGLTFAETDEMTMALELAVRGVPGWNAILAAQLVRIENPDRRARFAFVMPALSADGAEREAAFERFRDAAGRQREPWVVESLDYLHHPLREAHARRFIGPALELLREIQRTGDIFFPTRWMESTLAGHQSREAAAIVRDFLDRQDDYPERLRWTILTAADELFRASR